MAIKRAAAKSRKTPAARKSTAARKTTAARKGPVVRKSAASRKVSTTAKLNSELKQLGKRFDALAKQASQAQAGARVQYEKQLKALRVRQAAAHKALERFGRQSAAASGPLKSGLRKAWKDIDAAVRQATRRFRETN